MGETSPIKGGYTLIEREYTCRACEGTGMLADDEGWQYECSVCHGKGHVQPGDQRQTKIMSVDDNNRLLN